VLERLDGRPSDDPLPAQQRSLGRQLRRWHERGSLGGLRLDDPGGLGVLLEGYGWDAVDHEALDAVLPLMMLRRLVDTFTLGTRRDTKWLTGRLQEHAPHLLDVVAGELDL
jgi:hypothetical protein